MRWTEGVIYGRKPWTARQITDEEGSGSTVPGGFKRAIPYRKCLKHGWDSEGVP